MGRHHVLHVSAYLLCLCNRAVELDLALSGGCRRDFYKLMQKHRIVLRFGCKFHETPQHRLKPADRFRVTCAVYVLCSDVSTPAGRLSWQLDHRSSARLWTICTGSGALCCHTSAAMTHCQSLSRHNGTQA
jgi:hypothetical protein